MPGPRPRPLSLDAYRAALRGGGAAAPSVADYRKAVGTATPEVTSSDLGRGDINAAAGDFGLRASPPPIDPGQARRVRVRLGSDAPRGLDPVANALEDRANQMNPGLLQTGVGMAADVVRFNENAGRGLPAGVYSVADQLVRQARDLGSAARFSGVPGAQGVGAVADLLPTDEERARGSEAVEEALQPEGAGGAVGRTVGALSAATGATALGGRMLRLGGAGPKLAAVAGSVPVATSFEQDREGSTADLLERTANALGASQVAERFGRIADDPIRRRLLGAGLDVGLNLLGEAASARASRPRPSPSTLEEALPAVDAGVTAAPTDVSRRAPISVDNVAVASPPPPPVDNLAGVRERHQARMAQLREQRIARLAELQAAPPVEAPVETRTPHELAADPSLPAEQLPKTSDLAPQARRMTPERLEAIDHPEVSEARRNARMAQPTLETHPPEALEQRAKASEDQLYTHRGFASPEDAHRELGVAMGGERPEGQKPTLHVILGSPGAGKTSIFAKDIVEKAPWSYLVDADEAKKTLPEYEHGRGAPVVHEESSAIADRLLERLIRERKDVVFSKLGTNPAKMRGFLDAVADAGYDVQVKLAHISPEESAWSSHQRFRKTGRFVDPLISLEAGTKPLETYEHLKNHPAVTRAERFDNPGVDSGRQPYQVESIDREASSGIEAAPRAGEEGGRGPEAVRVPGSDAPGVRAGRGPGGSDRAVEGTPEVVAPPAAPTILGRPQVAGDVVHTPAPTKKPWEMSREEFGAAVERGRLHKPTGRKVPGESEAQSPLRVGELNGYSDDDIAHFYAKRRGHPEATSATYDPIEVGRQQLVADALAEGRTVPVNEESSVLANERGGAHTAAVSTLAGGLTGAAAGAATGDSPEDRVARALTFGVGGAIAGHMLGTKLTERVATATSLAATDPDIQGMFVGGTRPAAPADPLLSQAERAYTHVLDELYPLERLGKRTTGTSALGDEASRSTGWRGLASDLVGYKNSPETSLTKAIELARGREADVTALLQGERALELHGAIQNGNPSLPEGTTLKGFDLEKTQRAVAKLQQVPEVVAAAEAYRAFYDRMLQTRVENGLMSLDQATQMREANTRYVPFLRDFGEVEAKGKGGGKILQRGVGIRKMDPEQVARSPLRDPFEVAAEDAFKTARDVARQRVTNILTDMVKGHAAAVAPFIEELHIKGPADFPASGKARQNIVELNVKGDRRFYQVHDQDLLNAIEGTAPLAQDVVHKILSVPKKVLQAGVTIFPAFSASNASRDLVFTSAQYPVAMKRLVGGAMTGGLAGALYGEDGDKVPSALRGMAFGAGAAVFGPHIARTLTALGHVLRQDDVLKEWVREGGASTGFYIKTREDATRLVQQLRKGGYDTSDILNPRSWWEGLQDLNSAVESAPRLAQFLEARKTGKGMAAAVHAGQDVSVNFARMGSSPMVKTISGAKAFWNPNLQSKTKLFRMLKDPRTWAIGAAGITAPSIALWSLNKDDQEYWRRPLWERNLFWHVPVGQHPDGRTKFLKIPKPFEVGYIFASLPERLLDFAYQKDPERTKQALTDMLSQSTIDGLNPLPTAVQPLVEVNAGPGGYSFFRQRPIVPRGLENLPAREQVDARTSTPAVALARGVEKVTGGMVSPSPMKTDYLLRSFTGSSGSAVADLLTRQAKRVGLDDRPETETRSQWSRFVTRPGGFDSDAVEQVYRQYAEADAARQAVLAEKTPSRRQALQQRYAQQLRDYPRLHEAVGMLRDLRVRQRQVEGGADALDDRQRMSVELQRRAAELSERMTGGNPAMRP